MSIPVYFLTAGDVVFQESDTSLATCYMGDDLGQLKNPRVAPVRCIHLSRLEDASFQDTCMS